MDNTNLIIIIILIIIIVFMLFKTHITIIKPQPVTPVNPIHVVIPKPYVKPIGGCAGTQYGCCPNGVTARMNAAGTNC
jgi:hypothetical protein